MQARSEKIAEEEDKCRVMAENAQHDLDEALPALEEAMKVREEVGVGVGAGAGFVLFHTSEATVGWDGGS